MVKLVLIPAVALLLLLAQAIVSSSVEITIYPSCSGRRQPCSTISSLRSAATVLTLHFAPGIHNYTSSSALRFQRARQLEFKALSSTAYATVACTPRYYRSNIDIRSSSNVTIAGLTFSGCNIHFFRVNNTVIRNSTFINGRNGAFQFSYSHDITVDQCTISYNYDSAFGGVIEFGSSSGIAYTRNNITHNSVSSFGGIVVFSQSSGFVGCCNFRHNKASAYGGIITTKSSTSLTVTNSTFKNNSVSSFGGIIRLDSAEDNLVLVSSNFEQSTTTSFGGVIKIDNAKASATIIASRFVGSGNSHRHRNALIDSDSECVAFICCDFVSTTLPHKYNKRRDGLCEKFKRPGSETCGNSQCQLSHCQPLTAEVSLERSSYTVNEGIGASNKALQICAIVKDALFILKTNIQVHNGTAVEGSDFTTGGADCRTIMITPQLGVQKKCIFIRIIEDKITEGTEQFSVSMSSRHPFVSFKNPTAIVRVVEGDITMPTQSPTPGGAQKTAVVECGPFRRPLSYSTAGNELSNLRDAIVRAFRGLTGLQQSHIAVLQVKSDEHADYVDQLSSSPIDDNGRVKVILYHGFTCLPKSTN